MPQRSRSASAAPQRPLSLSPRRPVDSTNHQQRPSSRRTTLANPKSALNSKVTTRKQKNAVPSASTTRITRSMSARTGLQHSNSLPLPTVGSGDRSLSYKSAPAPGHIDIRNVHSRSFSAASSAEEELDSLLDDHFDLKSLSQESSVAEPPPVTHSLSSGSRSDTMFEPKLVHPSCNSEDDKSKSEARDSADSQSDAALFMHPRQAGQPTHILRNGTEEINQNHPSTDKSTVSIQEMFETVHRQHMQ